MYYHDLLPADPTETQIKQLDETAKVVEDVTNMINFMSFNQKNFNALMSRQHRTLQQSFTRLCLNWLDHCASDVYLTDGRNDGSKKAALKLKEMEKREQFPLLSYIHPI